MTAKAEQSAPAPREIIFTCKFCGETKPLSELVVMRHYFPQVPACKDCARGTRKSEVSEESPSPEQDAVEEQ